MSSKTTTRLAWGLWLVAVILIVASVSFGFINRDIDRGDSDSVIIGLVFSLETVASISVGAILAHRRPGNAIGWLLLGHGFISALAGAADGYAIHTLLGEPGSLPGGEVAASIAGSVIDSAALVFGFYTFLFLLFPYGTLPSPFWRRAVKFLVPVLIAAQVLSLLKPGEMSAFPIDNPLGVGFVEELQPLDWVLFVFLLVVICAAAFSLLRRFRRSSGEERQQLKWVVTAAVFIALTLVSGPLWWGLVPASISETAWPILFALSLASIPLACAFAILRYRLYEIDLIINRALVFGTLTAFLAGLYAASIQLFKTIFSGVTGETSDAALVATTLVLASLFTPAKNRLQKLVDRYFGHVPQTPDIHAYIDQLRFVIQVLDAEEGARRLLEQSVAKVNASGGAVFLHGPDERNVRVGSFDLQGGAVVRIAIEHAGHEFGQLLLGPRRDEMAYAAEDLEPLRTAATMFGHALALASGSAANADAVADEMPTTEQSASGTQQSPAG